MIKFDFMDAPNADSINTALRQLTLLEAVDLSQGGVQLTPLGKKMAAFPLDPRLVTFFDNFKVLEDFISS